MKNKKADKMTFKSLMPWVVFGLAVAFSAMIFMFWITQEVVQAIPMAILVGGLIGIAFKLFSDRINRDQKGKKR